VTIQPYSNDSSITLGATRLDAGDFIPPRVKIVQAMSAEANAEKDAAKVGDLVNTLTGENYGDALDFIPLQTFKQRILLVRDERRPAIEQALGTPISDGNGLKCRSFDMVKGTGEPGILCESCPLAQWDGGTPPLCTETYNVAAMTNLGDLIILSFAKSSAKTGKRLFSMLRMSHEKPWTRIYAMHTRKEKNDRGQFAVPDVKVTGVKTPPELIRVASEWARQLAGVQIDVTPLDEPVEEEDTGPAPF
jgi:hypothetical protein